ncbi:MAG: chlorite dismutase family protein, partial [Verrucomicrobiota bacterium]|nr:chlorite dismutase family protein [Verrucomicrobiota bacterium]
MTETNGPLIPEQGWHCLHLFYRIEFGQWQLLAPDEQREAKTHLAEVVQEVRALPDTQLLTLSVVTPKADVAFMLITPDLHTANRIEKQLTLSLGADVLVPAYSYLSLTEESEYAMTDEEQAGNLEREEKLTRGSAEFDAAMTAFRERMAKYRHERVYPTLPDWPVACFYNMNKRRGEQRN